MTSGVGSFSSIGGFLSQIQTSQAAGASGQDKTAALAKRALAKGIQDGGPVTEYKPTSDRSGASGENDYWSALGYDA